jgi:hypothetical protein
MGFLFQELQIEQRLIAVLKDYLKDNKFFPVLLSPEKDSKPGKANNLWKVDMNIDLESDI